MSGEVVGAIELPVSVAAFADWAEAQDAAHPGALVEQVGTQMIARMPGERCGCHVCDDQYREALTRVTGSFSARFLSHMILCPECGNKRCPHAAHHENACTGSNEPGQDGSAYP